MKNFMNLSSLVMIVLILQMLSSCTTNKLLSANFEDDNLGSLPNLNLPGAPVGDSMGCVECDSGDYRVVSKTTGVPPESTKWLEIFGNIPSNGNQRTVIFSPTSGSLNNAIYTVNWKGYITHPGSRNQPFSMSFFSGPATSSQVFFSLIFKDEIYRGQEVSSIYLSDISQNEENSELIGRVPVDAPHVYDVFISTEERTFTILGSGLPITIVRPIPSSIVNVKEPHVWLSFIEQGIGVYQIDQIQILEGKRTEE